MSEFDRDDRLKDRFRGAMLGVALGDALGAPFEGTAPILDGPSRSLPLTTGSLRYTDDTHMSIGIAESILACGDLDGEHLATTFMRNWEQEPWRGYGSGPPTVFDRIRGGTPWDEASQTLYWGEGSLGNGASMRVAPVALFAFQDLDRVAALARQSALITHAHDVGMDGAALQAVAIAWLLQRNEESPPERSVMCGMLQQRAETDALRQAIGRVALLSDDSTLRLVLDELGHGIQAHRSVPTALHAFLRSPDSFEEIVSFVACLGGDTDTIGAMAGALAGAYLRGARALPAKWLEVVEGGDMMCRLADELYDLAAVRA